MQLGQATSAIRGQSRAIVGKNSIPGTSIEADRILAEYWTSFADTGQGAVEFVLRNPLRSLRALRAVLRLPVVATGRPSDQPGGQAIDGVLALRGPFGTPARWWGYAVLPIPDDPADHLDGSTAQTLRRKIRAAAKHGVSCRLVQAHERTGLLARANHRDRNHSDERYRDPAPRNEDILRHKLWMVAEDGNGAPLLLAVIPVDGEFATLRYFRALGEGQVYSLSRYLATHAVVRELSKIGVRWLLDNTPPGAQTNGLRHFQRMVGFRYMRVGFAARGCHAKLAGQSTGRLRVLASAPQTEKLRQGRVNAG